MKSTVYTYLILDKLSGFVKIGKSKNVKKRLQTLSTSNLNLHLLYYAPIDIERLLHKLFKHRKISKEWYQLNLIDVKNIIELIQLEFYKL